MAGSRRFDRSRKNKKTSNKECVKGALMARYSRSARGLREIYDAEFKRPAGGGETRADELYARVLGEYGDDSVAQLGSAHVCVEGASNVATKILERGRLMSYLEQSTRYIRYDQRDAAGRWRWVMPPPGRSRRHRGRDGNEPSR